MTSNAMKFMYITNDINVIRELDGVVDIIFIDFEILGKEDRQKGLDTVKSKHTINDLKLAKEKTRQTKILVRVNPINKGSRQEIADIVKFSPEYVMLPYFKNRDDVHSFISFTKGCNIKRVLLVETAEALMDVEYYANLDGIDVIYFGLNDLHLELKMSNMFEPVANGIIEEAIRLIKGKVDYGFGGIGRLRSGLPVNPKLILSEHKRLGSKYLILSRSFSGSQFNVEDFSKELIKINSQFESYSADELENNHRELKKSVGDLVGKNFSN